LNEESEKEELPDAKYIRKKEYNNEVHAKQHCEEIDMVDNAGKDCQRKRSTRRICVRM
jgi:hypothetical protein